MKKLALLLYLFCLSTALGKNYSRGYEFVKDFTLDSAKATGDEIIIKLKHKESYGKAAFYFSPAQACKESFPPQCSGTVIRLDQNMEREGTAFSEISIKPEEVFNYPRPMVIEIIGPDKNLKVRF